MADFHAWPLPGITPEDFYKLDRPMQVRAGRMAVAFIEATFSMAEKAADMVLEKARLSSLDAFKRKPRRLAKGKAA